MFRLVFFISLIGLQVYSDPTIRECKKKRGVVLIVLHHIFFLTAMLGSILFGYHKYHLMILVGALLVHVKRGDCPLTKIHNQMCGFDENKPLITLLNRLIPNYPNNVRTVIYAYYTIVFGLLVYDGVITRNINNISQNLVGFVAFLK